MTTGTTRMTSARSCRGSFWWGWRLSSYLWPLCWYRSVRVTLLWWRIIWNPPPSRCMPELLCRWWFSPSPSFRCTLILCLLLSWGCHGGVTSNCQFSWLLLSVLEFDVYPMFVSSFFNFFFCRLFLFFAPKQSKERWKRTPLPATQKDMPERF